VGARGRRPGQSTTRVEIVEAARALFGSHGYEGATLRMIADAAGVDPALVSRVYRDKPGLFRAAVEWPWDPAEVIPRIAAGARSRAGYRLTKEVIDTWEDSEQRAPILALLASTGTSDVARRLLRDFVSTQVHVPFVRSCGFDQPELRGSLLGAHTLGLCMARYVLAIEPLATLDPVMLVEVAGAAAQRVLTSPLPAP
jgi:AcrR family transcriptional regulator